MDKKCSRCKEVKSIEEFRLVGAKRPGARRAVCRGCSSADEKNRRGQKRLAEGRENRRRTPEQIQKDISARTKVCAYCRERKSFDEFYPNKNSCDTVDFNCIKCCSTIMSKWRKDNPVLAKARDRRNTLSYLYGLTLKDYSALEEKQGGACAICGATDTGYRNTLNLVIDHCHETGVVRGLLCHHCNRGLGHFRDSEEVMIKAIQYIKESKGEEIS